MLLSLVPAVAAVVAAAQAVLAAVVPAVVAAVVAAARQKPKQERIAQILSISTASSIKAQWAALVVAAAVEARVLQVVLVAQAELADMAAVLLFLGLLVFYSCQGVLMYLRQMVAETVRLVHRHRQPRMVVQEDRARLDGAR